MEKIMIGRIEGNKYYGDSTDEGYIFKDEDAFYNRHDDICYIAEAGFSEAEEDNHEWYLTADKAFDEIERGGAETYNSIFAMTKEYLIDELGEDKVTDDFVAWECEGVFQELTWCCYGTALDQVDIFEDYEYYCEKKKELGIKLA